MWCLLLRQRCKLEFLLSTTEEEDKLKKSLLQWFLTFFGQHPQSLEFYDQYPSPPFTCRFACDVYRLVYSEKVRKVKWWKEVCGSKVCDGRHMCIEILLYILCIYELSTMYILLCYNVHNIHVILYMYISILYNYMYMYLCNKLLFAFSVTI